MLFNSGKALFAKNYKNKYHNMTNPVINYYSL